jgi:opacity protein-like surface antigen
MKPTTTLAALAATALAATSALAGVAPAPAPPPYTPAPSPVGGPYLDISAGPLWISDIGNAEFDTGWGINAEIGYALGNGLSFGFSGGYGTADLDVGSLDVPGRGSISFSGELETIPLLGTINYSFPITGSLSGYIGAGAGVLYVDGDSSVTVRGRTFGSVSEDEWNFALQGRAGLSFALSENASLNIGYRYIHGFFSDDDYKGQMAEGGFTIRF